jgi:hypothetical protein
LVFRKWLSLQPLTGKLKTFVFSKKSDPQNLL